MSDFDKSYWRALLQDAKTYSALLAKQEKAVGALIEYRVPQTLPAAAISGEAAAGSQAAAGSLAGLPFAVKNNIAMKGWRLSCGSKLLSELVSPYTATAVQRLEAAGAVPVASTNLDEFGMGSSTDTSAIKKTNNPWDASRVAGGSSGGSAAAVAAGEVPFALGSDTGGSVRQPAAFCGVYGLKPSYGGVSRYGLTAYASSLEGIGVLSDSAALCEEVFSVIRGRDEHDLTSADWPEPSSDSQPRRVAVLADRAGLSDIVASELDRCVEELQAMGFECREVSLPSLEYAVPAYYTIAAAEASANLARFNGIRYGLRPFHSESPQDLIMDARSDGFGDEVKLRIMLGTFVLRSGFQEQYYEQAQKIRTLIRSELDSLFQSEELLLSPVFPRQAFAHGDDSMDPFEQKLADKFTVTANLAGIPALSFPTSLVNGLPVGLQVHAPAFAEDRLFSFARRWEALHPLQRCPLALGGAK